VEIEALRWGDHGRDEGGKFIDEYVALVTTCKKRNKKQNYI
jgi:hypothetical protein